MSFNTFGHLFRFTTWGESHGPAIGVVVDGCPPGIPLSAEIIQRDLDRRKPGQSRFTTAVFPNSLFPKSVDNEGLDTSVFKRKQ